MRAAIRYSEAFKQQVLRDLDTGRFASKEAAKRAYGIRGQGTIAAWAVKYGKDHLVGKVVRVETAKEVSELKALRQRVRVLEKALVDERLERMLESAYVQIACRTAGIEDVDGFKKKHAGKV